MELTEQDYDIVDQIRNGIHHCLVGQNRFVDELLLGILADGHMLVEGLPGLAKTLAVKTLASLLGTSFTRVQFTPDLLPADLIGTMVYDQKEEKFVPHKGPLFTHILLADEINRAPAKVQSALLEAMGERQITLGEKTYPLGDPFLVFATQNPIEESGTYPLPEAQLDRFMLKVVVDYPSKEDELEMLDLYDAEPRETAVKPILRSRALSTLKRSIEQIGFDQKLKEYVVDFVSSTRPINRKKYPVSRYIEVGSSPRASLALVKCARVHAFLSHRDVVLPEDIQAVALPVLRHRIVLSYEAEAEGVTAETVVSRLAQLVKIP